MRLEYINGGAAYSGLAQKYKTRLPKYGGGCNESAVWLGGANLTVDVIKQYENSLNSFTKQALLDDILKSLESVGFKVNESDTYDQKLKKLIDEIPNARNKKTFKEDVQKHIALCRKIASSINKHFPGGDIIDLDASPEVICQSVAELIASMMSGMRMEFMAVSTDIQKVIKNLYLLSDQLRKVVSPALDIAETSTEPGARANVAKYRSVVKIIDQEAARQLALLQNLFNSTVTPAEKTLLSLIESEKDLQGVLELISLKPGKQEFGRSLAMILQGLAVGAEYAHIIDKALKTVGMTADQYENIELRPFKELIVKNMAESDETKLEKFIDAFDLLNENFSKRKDIVKILKQKTGGNMGDYDAFSEVEGGADADYERSTIDKRLDTDKKRRTLIFKMFSTTLDTHMAKITRALDTMSKKLGTSIRLSDEMDGFVSALAKLRPILQYKNSYLALIGYYGDALSKERRDTFLTQLKLIEAYLDSMIAMPSYASSHEYFKEVKSAISGLEQTIAQYSGQIAAKYGAGGCAEQESACDAGDVFGELMKTDKDSAGAVSGGADWQPPAESVLRQVPKSFSEIIYEFNYYYKVAQINQNLSATASENDNYAENYETMRGEAIAEKIDELRKAREELLGTKFTELKTTLLAGSSGEELKTKEKIVENTKKAITEHFIVREKFWQTVEALDEYMRVFTNSMAKHHDKLQSIKSMLDETEITHDWYSEETGQYIHELFDIFPSFFVGKADATCQGGLVMKDTYCVINDTALNARGGITARQFPLKAIYDTKDKHYYSGLDQIKTIMESQGQEDFSWRNALPGNPFLVTDCDSSESGFSGFEKMKSITRNLLLLKNIISIFIHVGSSFGDGAIYKKIFMQPTKIYSNLCDYLNICSFGFQMKKNIEIDISTGVVNESGNIPVTYYGNKVVLGVSASVLDPATSDSPMEKWRAQYGIYMRGTYDELRGGLEAEDNMFKLIIKSMCAKVLTVMGLFDVFERPDEPLAYNPVRWMLGGSVAPPIEDRAVELYLRLPLLLEFYRDLFDFYSTGEASEFVTLDPRQAGKTEKISMLPEMTGPFSGLIRLVFKKHQGTTLSDYSDSELQFVIEEVNSIWKALADKGADSPVQYIIMELVKEVNKRYGIVSEKDRNLYEREHDSAYRRQAYADDLRDIDIPLLPGEEDIDFETDPIAPSKRFENAELAKLSLRTLKSKNYIAAEHEKLVKKFRCMLDAYFHKNSFKQLPAGVEGKIENEDIEGNYNVNSYRTPGGIFGEKSFKPLIKNTRIRLSKETGPDARFKLLSTMIRGAHIMSKSDHLKYVMFHETVITGLNTLGAVYAALANFRNVVLSTDLELITTLGKGQQPLLNTTIQAALDKKYGEITKFKNAYLKPQGNLSNPKELDAGLNLELLFGDFLEAIFAVSNDFQNLVTIRIDDDKIILNFSHMQEHITNMITQISYFIDTMRDFIEPDIIERYTAKMRVGSLYWYQEQFVEKLFTGRAARDDRSGPAFTEYVTLDGLNRKINSTLKIARESDFEWGPLFARLLFYNSQNQFNVVPINAQYLDDSLSPISKLFKLKDGRNEIDIPQYRTRYMQFYSWDPSRWVDNGSLVFTMNQLLAKYINLCFDASSDKLYINTISHLLNGIANNGIINLEKNFPDTLAKGAAVTGDYLPAARLDWSDPNQDELVFLSIAYVIRNLTQSKNNQQIPTYVTNNLSEVAIFKKEELRAHLPHFRALFRELVNKAEYIKQIMNLSEVNCARPALAASVVISQYGLTAIARDDVNGSTRTRAHFTAIASNVVQIASSVIASIDHVLRELADEPKYLETHTNFIEEYKTMNNVDPFMPLSNALYVLRNNKDNEAYNDKLPLSSVGSAAFKLAYGTRLLLNSPGVTFSPAEHAPGWHKLVEYYNMSAADRNQFDVKKCNEYSKCLVTLLRYAHEFRNYKGYMTPFTSGDGSFNDNGEYSDGAISRMPFIDTQSTTALQTNLTPRSIIDTEFSDNKLDYATSNNAPAYSLCDNRCQNVLALLVDLVENGVRDRSLERVAKHVIGHSSAEYGDMKIANLLDLNIVPINVHALMREIPLINLYNYGYTFDRLIIEKYYGINNDFGNLLIWNLCNKEDNTTNPQDYRKALDNYGVSTGKSMIKSSRDLMVSMLIDPYQKLNTSASYSYLAEMFRGSGNIPLGRPKFLSDQLFNKALFGEIYPSSEDSSTYNTSLSRSPNNVDGSSHLLSYPIVHRGREHNPESLRSQNGVKMVDVDADVRRTLDTVGKLRTNTVFVRNLIFMSNILRTMRMKLHDDLQYDKSVIVSKNAVTREDNTEFILNQTLPMGRQSRYRDEIAYRNRFKA